MFIWTVLILMAYVVMVLYGFSKEHRHLPEIQTSLVALIESTFCMSDSSRFQDRIPLGHLPKKLPDQHMSLTCVLSCRGKIRDIFIFTKICTLMEPILALA